MPRAKSSASATKPKATKKTSTRKNTRTTKKSPAKKKPACDCAAKEYTNVLDSLKEVIHTDHNTILQHVDVFKSHIENIDDNTKGINETLKNFREDNREYVQLIAGKKQVPISIFAIIVLLLVTLLVASEVRYSNVDVSIGGNRGITITPNR